MARDFGALFAAALKRAGGVANLSSALSCSVKTIEAWQRGAPWPTPRTVRAMRRFMEDGCPSAGKPLARGRGSRGSVGLFGVHYDKPAKQLRRGDRARHGKPRNVRTKERA